MLKAKSLVSVLAQPIEQHHDPSRKTDLISSMVVAKDGSLVGSYHSTKIPPTARTDQEAQNSSKSQVITPYHVDRPMQTKLYAVYASAAWREYANEETNEEGWLNIRTADAMIFIEEIDDQLLYVLVANTNTTVGFLSLKSSQTVSVLKRELKDFKFH